MRIAEVLQYSRTEGAQISDIKCDLGGGNIVQARHYQAPGEDSYPLVGDYALLTSASGEWIAHAFMDPSLMPTAQEGERVFFSRSGLGSPEAIVHLKADGTTEVNGTDPVAMSSHVDEALASLRSDMSSIITAVANGLSAVGAGTAANGPAASASFNLEVAGLPADLPETASTRLKSE